MSKSYYGVALERNTEEDQKRIAEWAKSLDENTEKYASDEEEFGRDDSEEFRWEHEFKLKCERSASHIHTHINFADCYESEIMGRSNGYILKGEM